jgi:hypothetical protein
MMLKGFYTPKIERGKGNRSKRREKYTFRQNQIIHFAYDHDAKMILCTKKRDAPDNTSALPLKSTNGFQTHHKSTYFILIKHLRE